MSKSNLALITTLLLTAQVQAQTVTSTPEPSKVSTYNIPNENISAGQCTLMDEYNPAVALSARCN